MQDDSTMDESLCCRAINRQLVLDFLIKSWTCHYIIPRKMFVSAFWLAMVNQQVFSRPPCTSELNNFKRRIRCYRPQNEVLRRICIIRLYVYTNDNVRRSLLL